MAELCNQSELHANQMTECKKQLLAHAADAFEAGSKPIKVVDLVPLQAKIGQLALGNDFLESALTKAGSLSAKLSSRPRSQTACYPTGQTAQSQPRLCALPAQAGKCCRSGTLMRRTGIEALAPQPSTSKATSGSKIYPYLLRKLAIVRANKSGHWTPPTQWHGDLLFKQAGPLPLLLPSPMALFILFAAAAVAQVVAPGGNNGANSFNPWADGVP